MKLRNEFTVAAPLETAWPTLLDIERVASCLPGATIEPTGEAGVFRGSMTVKLGPVTADYQGSARLQDVDEDSHTASIAVQAREARGQGSAAAVIRNHLESRDGGTHVVAETDLQITGRQAQFGRGIMEDLAGAMLEDFAGRFERELQRGDGPEAASPPADHRHGPSSEGVPDILDLGATLGRTQVARYAPLAALALLALVLVLVARRRPRRRFRLELDLGR